MVGVGFAGVLTPAAAQVTVNGCRMFDTDLHTGWTAAATVVAMVVAASALVAALVPPVPTLGPWG